MRIDHLEKPIEKERAARLSWNEDLNLSNQELTELLRSRIEELGRRLAILKRAHNLGAADTAFRMQARATRFQMGNPPTAPGRAPPAFCELDRLLQTEGALFEHHRSACRFISVTESVVLPPLRSSSMPRSQANQPKLPLKDRMALHASRLTEEAKLLRPGPERDALMHRAHHADTASLRMNGSCRRAYSGAVE